MVPMSLSKYGYKSYLLEPTYANLEHIPDRTEPNQNKIDQQKNFLQRVLK